MDEHNHQRLIVAWFRNRYPDLDRLFFAIPNGGKRDPVTARRLKDEGVLPGVPDLLLAVQAGGYAGLFIEAKTRTGAASKAQKEVGAALAGQGYSVVVAKGYEAMKAAIQEYLGPNP
jgi:hypothetical protein